MTIRGNRIPIILQICRFSIELLSHGMKTKTFWAMSNLEYGIFGFVIKEVEKIMMDEETDKGIDSDVIDLISANLINERIPTCYGKDRRWANHLYPVFLTESYVKSKYLSTEMFLHLF